MTDQPEQLPPQDLHAEQATLGACLVEPQAVDLAVATGLKPKDFYRPAHETIFRAILQEHGDQKPIDLVTVTGRLRKMDALDAVGGPAYLVAVTREAATAAHVVRYVELVQDRAKLRGLIAVGASISEMAWRPDTEGDEAVTQANALLDALNEYGTGGMSGETAMELVGRAGGRILDRYAKPLQIDGARFGIPPIDEHLGGLPRQGVTTARANTSMGKTALTSQATLQSAMAGVNCGYINLEGGNEVVVAKMVQQRSAVDRFSTRRAGGADKGEMDRVAAALDFIRRLPIEFYAPSGLHFPELQALITHMKRKSGVELVVVDFIQQLLSLGRDAYQDAKETSTRLADLALRLDISLLMASQVTRTETGELRTRGASEYEHHSEAVITILKMLAPSEAKGTSGYDLARTERQSPRCYINLDKWRQGPVGRWPVVWSGARQTFFSLYDAGRTLDMDGLREDFDSEEWAEISRGMGQKPAEDTRLSPRGGGER